MNDLKIFKNSEFGEIRTTVVNNEPMFCLADVCRALESTTPSKVKERLNEKGVSSIPTLTAGGLKEMTFINESNLYKVIFQSRKPEAERFSDWVTSEVLPTIRKTGGLFDIKDFKNKSGKFTGVQTLITPKGKETFRMLLESR